MVGPCSFVDSYRTPTCKPIIVESAPGDAEHRTTSSGRNRPSRDVGLQPTAIPAASAKLNADSARDPDQIWECDAVHRTKVHSPADFQSGEQIERVQRFVESSSPKMPRCQTVPAANRVSAPPTRGSSWARACAAATSKQ